MIYCVCDRYFDTWESRADDSRFCSHSCEAQLWLPPVHCLGKGVAVIFALYANARSRRFLATMR
jgi:hypothetical protein